VKSCLACGHQFDDKGWKCPSCSYVPQKIKGYWRFAPDLVNYEDGFDARYFSELIKIEEKNWWFRSRNKLIIWALHRYFPKAENFFEIGCGTGFVLSGIKQAFPDLFFSGGELFSEGLAHARRRLPDVSLFQMDARKIPFEDEFDVIGAFDVLEHVQDDEDVLLEIVRAVKNGGGLIVTVPQHPILWSYVDEYSYHKRRYRRKELVRKVKKVGFQEIWCTSFVSLLLPLMLIIRVRKHKKPKHFDPLEEFMIVDSLNHTLLKIMSAELFLIRAGISLPVGGSLLLVAKK
jgi:SAM-dependent methyltransferase